MRSLPGGESIIAERRYGRIIAVGIVAMVMIMLGALPAQAAGTVLYTSDMDWSNGTLTNISLSTERYNVSAGDLELDFAYADDDGDLTSYWRFEGDMTDETGLNDGAGGVTAYTDGKFGRANDRDVMTVANDSTLQPGTGDMTIMFWFQRKASSLGVYEFYVHGVSNTIMFQMAHNYSIEIYSNMGAEEEYYGTVGYYDQANVWYFIAATWDNTENYWQIYVNGIRPAQWVSLNGTTTSQVCDGDIAIGNGYMRIDEIKAYSRALSLSEISALYNGGIQYATEGIWTGPIIEKPDLDAISCVLYSVSVGGPDSCIDKLAIVDILTGTEIATYANNITSSGSIGYSEFRPSLIVTRGKICQLRAYLAGNGTTTPTIAWLRVDAEPVGALPGGGRSTENNRILGAISVARGANKVILTYTGPEAAFVRWDFGDGEGAEGTRVIHIYDEPGNYTVTVYATMEDGSEYWGEADINFAVWGTVLEMEGESYHITITNATLFASGFIMIITASVYPDIKPWFKWNTARLRICIGLLMVAIATIYTVGVL